MMYRLVLHVEISLTKEEMENYITGKGSVDWSEIYWDLHGGTISYTDNSYKQVMCDGYLIYDSRNEPQPSEIIT